MDIDQRKTELRYLIGSRYRESSYLFRVQVLEQYAKAAKGKYDIRLSEVARELYVVPACIFNHVHHLIDIGLMYQKMNGRYSVTENGFEYLELIND